MVSLVVGLGFVGYFAWHAVHLTYDSWQFNDMAQGVVAVPLWIPQLGYAGGLVILSIAIPRRVRPCRPRGQAGLREARPQTAEEVVERAVRAASESWSCSRSPS